MGHRNFIFSLIFFRIMYSFFQFTCFIISYSYSKYILQYQVLLNLFLFYILVLLFLFSAPEEDKTSNFLLAADRFSPVTGQTLYIYIYIYIICLLILRCSLIYLKRYFMKGTLLPRKPFPRRKFFFKYRSCRKIFTASYQIFICWLQFSISTYKFPNRMLLLQCLHCNTMHYFMLICINGNSCIFLCSCVARI